VARRRVSRRFVCMNDRLRHVRWLGGGSGAGKTTVAGRLAQRYGVTVYSTDDVMRAHAAGVSPEKAPFLHRFMAMNMDQRWVERTPQVMLETFHWFLGEGFELIVEDLVRTPVENVVVVEGFRLLPRLVLPLLEEREHAVWLLPTPAFRAAAIAKRGPEWGVPPLTSRPDVALRNLLARDRLFTERLRGETAALGLASIDVDGRVSEDELVARVAGLFGLRRPGFQ
jgi:AAA domain